MSEGTLRIARESYEAWNRNDLEGLLAVTAEDFEFQSHGSMLGLPERIEGKHGIREVYAEWFSGPWAGALAIEVEHLIEVDDERVLALLTLRGEGQQSGHVERAHLLRIRDGLTSRTEAYGSWDEGLRAAGLERIPD